MQNNMKYKNIKNKNIRAFTLIETMVGILIITTAIIGPLSVAFNSAVYAKYTKDKITAIYLAQEAVDILRFERDSLLIDCNDVSNSTCPLQDLGLGDGTFESTSNAAWRRFKTRLGMDFNLLTPLSPPSCFVDSSNVGDGCSFDFYGFTQNVANDPIKYSPLSPNCDYLYRDEGVSAVTGGAYLCKASSLSFNGSHKTKFQRVVKLKSIRTIEGGAASLYLERYNDDVAVSSVVSYAKSHGFQAKPVEVVDFLHSKI